MLINGVEMSRNVCKMLKNVENWRAEMIWNVGRKCQGMWMKSLANVIKCLQMLNATHYGNRML